MSPAGQPRPLTHYAMLSIAAAVVTIILKLAAWHLTGSVGLLSDALESVVNLVAAVLALASLWVAAWPADEDHAHGHTKVEYFSGGMEGALILLAAVGIGWTSVERFFHPQPLNDVGVGLAVSGVASVINFIVARILFRVAHTRHSVALEADGHHLMTDVWTSLVVVIAVALVAVTGWNRLDPILGMLLALHIVFVGVKLMRQSMMGLMDTVLPNDEMETIRAILERHAAEGMQYHALRTRVAGARRFMSVHLLVPGAWTVARGHDLAEQIENEIRLRVERINVLTHLEPLEDPVSWDDVELERKEKNLATGA
jgi:cation diffusion facilitator family transporter